MAIKSDARARKTALRIVGILGIVMLLCCTGTAWFTYSISEGLSTRMTELDTRVGATFPQGTVWRLEQLLTPAPERAMKRVFVVGFPEPVPEERHAEIVDEVWTMYCETFADGGIALEEIAVGVAGEGTPERAMEENIRHAGSVNEWIGNRYDVADAAERTGLPAPPDVDLLEWLGDSATVTVGEDGGE